MLFHSRSRGFVVSNLHLELDSFLPFNGTSRTSAQSPATAILPRVNGIFQMTFKELLQPWVRLVPAALPGTLTSDSVSETEVKAVITALNEFSCGIFNQLLPRHTMLINSLSKTCIWVIKSSCVADILPSP